MSNVYAADSISKDMHMKRTVSVVGALALLGLSVIAARGQTGSSVKTWVSNVGTDSGSCSVTAPCRTFAYAITQTSAGGEIDVKDSGPYGSFAIAHSVSIVSDGSLAEIAVPSGGIGVAINAGSGDKIILQGLTIDGHSVGQDGIDFSAGMSLKVENCHIRNVTHIGISLQPVGAKVFSVSNTEVANAGSYGILVQPFNTSPLSSFSGLDLHDNGTGLFVGYVTTVVTSSTISENSIGIGTEVGANVLLGQTAVAENTSYGIQTQGGQITSYGDNYINGNGSDISGSFGSGSKR